MLDTNGRKKLTSMPEKIAILICYNRNKFCYFYTLISTLLTCGPYLIKLNISEHDILPRISFWICFCQSREISYKQLKFNSANQFQMKGTTHEFHQTIKFYKKRYFNKFELKLSTTLKYFFNDMLELILKCYTIELKSRFRQIGLAKNNSYLKRW